MPSRRRSRNKNLGNNLADVQRRLRYLERRPVRTKLANRVVTKSSIAPNSVSPDEVSFGITEVVPPGVAVDNYAQTIENPKDGLFLISSTPGSTYGATQVYSGTNDTYIDVADPVASASADAAAATAALAAANAAAAQVTADGKNAVYRQATAPTTPVSGASFSVGDVWFNTSQDGLINRWNGSAWSPLTLGNNALASISANKITAGTIDASVITVTNITANNITSGSIAASLLTTTQLNATNITSGTLSASRIGAGTINATISIQGPSITGGTISLQSSGTGTGLFRTDTIGRRIEITDSDDIIFYGDAARAGTITSIGASWVGGGDDPYTVSGGVMIYGGNASVSQGSSTYPSIVASSDATYMYGDASTRFQAGTGLLGLYGPFGNLYNDVTHIYSGYSTTANNTPWHTKMTGRLVFAENIEGPLSSGTGAPSSNGQVVGQVVFRYV